MMNWQFRSLRGLLAAGIVASTAASLSAAIIDPSGSPPPNDPNLKAWYRADLGLTLDIDGTVTTGQTDEDGVLVHSLPPAARRGRLYLARAHRAERGLAAALLATVDILLDRRHLSDDEFARIAEHFTSDQIFEIVQLVGFYHGLAMLIGTFDIRPEPGTPPIPA